ncbi:MAG: ABC transporter ATP-binding protein [Armatimonadota bacterium]|jgi:iron complex transport system ATP-binding protein
MGEAVLEARALHCGYDGREVVAGVDMALRRGEFLGLIGPNGSGKTTLLRALAGRLAPTSGEVLLEGTPMRARPRREVARTLAVVPQISSPPFEFTVGEIVAMGRTPHLGRLEGEGSHDRAAIERALALTHTERLRDRPVTELSGGEFQRVVIARALAQEAPVMLLDEPAAHLDIGHQVDIFDLLLRLNRNEERSILCVSHDLNLAARYCDRLVAVADGAVAAEGTPAEVLTEECVSELYRCSVRVEAGPDGRPRVTPLSGIAAGDLR